jgi:hypothetical protein
MDLYLDSLPELEKSFRKEAGFAARLSEAPENWPQELTSELMKQLPFLSDYEVSVNLDRVEPQRGFAFGYADVTNRTERPEMEHAEMGIPHIRIPIVIVERSVKPFSIFMDGERVVPLNEERVRELLFNPQTFDLSSSEPRDPSLMEATMPPNRTSFMGNGDVKMASVRSLLRSIAPTIRETDVEQFTAKVASDASLQAGFRRAGVAGLLIDVFEKTARASSEDRLQALAENITPTVMTIQKLPGGDFLVKSANVNAFAGGPEAQGQVVPEEEVAGAMGADNAQMMQPGQVATAVSDPVADKPLVETNEKIIEEFGEYLVQDSMGNRLMGWVFPKVLAWDGNFSPQQIALFTNGSAYALQDTVAGELVGKGTTLPKDMPRGDGCFYTVDGGQAICTAPVTIGSSAAGPDGLQRFMGTDVFGTPVQVSLQDGIKTPMRVSDSEYALPSNWKFMRLNNQTELVSDPVQMNKAAHVRQEKEGVTLFWNGSYNLTGGCGLHKLASEFKQDLDPVGAEFMLGLLGVDGQTAKQKVAEARRKGSVKLAGLKTITTLGERYQESVKTASALLHKVPDLRRDLIKEAAVMDDAGTVDNLLALNFINPENISLFMEYLPELEQCSEKLAEMLMYCYLGMRELPEGAVERAMKNLEEVIAGLKALQNVEA